MKNWKSILLLALVFFAGITVGVASAHFMVRREVQNAIAHPEKFQAVMEHNLTRRLRLDSDQQAKLHTILSDTRAELADLRKQMQPQAAIILHDMDEKISAMLTPEQKTRYDRTKEKTWPGLRHLQQPQP